MTRGWVGLLIAGLQRAVYALVALPVALWCLGLLAVGRVGAVGVPLIAGLVQAQLWVASRTLAAPL
jgi:hypothetical protein